MITVSLAPRDVVSQAALMFDKEKLLALVKEHQAEYVEVARVDTDSLDTAFSKTNHIDYEWWENEGVTVLGDDASNPSYRSASVGDILDCDGVKYVVAPCGFERL